MIPDDLTARAERPVCANPVDCCRELSRVWEALGVKEYRPGQGSASEQVAGLKARVRELDAEQRHIICPLCGGDVRQVSSATLGLALFQHVRWVCRAKQAAEAEVARLTRELETQTKRAEDLARLERADRRARAIVSGLRDDE